MHSCRSQAACSLRWARLGFLASHARKMDSLPMETVTSILELLGPASPVDLTLPKLSWKEFPPCGKEMEQRLELFCFDAVREQAVPGYLFSILLPL